MGAGAWILAFVNASAASVLLTAGLAKHVTPQPVQRALNEVAGTAVWPGLLRAFATAEIAVAIALSVPALRAAAVVGVVGLGLCFAVVGALAVVAYLVASLLGVAVNEQVRRWIFVLVCVGLAVADLADRTPYVWRQVPQQLVNTLPPGALGLVWGFDLGLLFTTQKVASLIWVAVAGVTLIEPTLVWVVLVGVAVIASLAVIAGSSRERTATWLIMKGRRRMTAFRRASGVAIAALAIAAATQAWPG